MADLENPILPGGEEDDLEATTAEQDEESTLLHCLSVALSALVMTVAFVLMLRFCHSHPTIMGLRALGVVAYAVAVAGVVISGFCIFFLVALFLCGNIDGERQQDELPT